MGFRFRKSINLGGGMRINLSKSGVGYSFGVKGFRVTKKANGGTRTTVSIPGSGLSYVHESSGGKQNSRRSSGSPTPNTFHSDVNNTYDTQEIKNANATMLVSEGLEDMLAAATKSLRLYSWASIGFWVTLVLGFGFPPFLLATVALFICALYIRKNGVIDLDYSFEDNQAAEVLERMKPLTNIAKSKKLWYISQTSKVIDKKYAAGASNTIKRNKCKVSTSVPFPFKTNTETISFILGKESLLFLPDKLFVIQGTKVGVLSYSDVVTRVHGQRFIESETVPKDAQIVDYTWQYVNKSGGPDKRFQNNRKLPVCLYGELEVRSNSGLNTDIMFSNPNIQ